MILFRSFFQSLFQISACSITPHRKLIFNIFWSFSSLALFSIYWVVHFIIFALPQMYEVKNPVDFIWMRCYVSKSQEQFSWLSLFELNISRNKTEFLPFIHVLQLSSLNAKKRFSFGTNGFIKCPFTM